MKLKVIVTMAVCAGVMIRAFAVDCCINPAHQNTCDHIKPSGSSGSCVSGVIVCENVSSSACNTQTGAKAVDADSWPLNCNSPDGYDVRGNTPDKYCYTEHTNCTHNNHLCYSDCTC